MAHIIDTRHSDDYLVIIGGALALPTSMYSVADPIDGSLRFNMTAVEVFFADQWHRMVTNTTAQPYIIALASGASTLIGGQIIACHRFASDVTFAADFGSGGLDLSSGAGCLVPATNLMSMNIDLCLAANDPTLTNNWITIGTVVIAAGGHTAVLNTVDHAAKSVAQGDFLRCVGAPTSDPTMANFFITLVGRR